MISTKSLVEWPKYLYVLLLKGVGLLDGMSGVGAGGRKRGDKRTPGFKF